MENIINVVQVILTLIFLLSCIFMLFNLIDDRKLTNQRIVSLKQSQELDLKIFELRAMAVESLQNVAKKQEKKLSHRQILRKHKISLSLVTHGKKIII